MSFIFYVKNILRHSKNLNKAIETRTTILLLYISFRAFSFQGFDDNRLFLAQKILIFTMFPTSYNLLKGFFLNSCHGDSFDTIVII